MSASKQVSKSAIAVVGMAGRFPGARNLTEFWRNLRDGVESLATFSPEELAAAGVSAELLANPAYVKAGSALERADEFDAAFFGVNPREAEVMDPQHRLFLECAWEALEDAGCDVDRLTIPVGVFAGASMNTYVYANLLANPQALAAVGAYQAMIGNDKDFVATRVSYKLNLRGPGVTVQTACSTSLVAVHMACESLLSHACDMALAGGVSLSFPQRAGYLYQDGMIFSPDGKVRPFDAKGQGIRAGEGVGIVVLKRLEDALAAGDPIRAVILGSAINNDGANKIGYTAPSIDGQAEAIATAQAIADVDPATLGYIEAHGTATPLGDPIEIAALTKVFRTRTEARQFCAIGSVKSNIGHLDAAAGVAGLIKAVLSLQHEQIPPSLNFETPNPQIDFANSPFFVNAALRPWPAGATPRRAAVSSFGIGGTNAHAVLQEAPSRPASAKANGSQLLVLSARTPAALDAATQKLADFLAASPDVNLADVAYTLQTGRRAFDHRRVLLAADAEAARVGLADRRRLVSSHCEMRGRPAVFMFSGQGSQYVGMGAQLYQSEPVVRAAVDECAAILQPILQRDLREVMFGQQDASASELGETWLTQPALFTIEYSLAQLWEHWGVVPQAMVGHSIGEYVAACVAGVFDLRTALQIVARRGELMQRCEAGSMLSVSLPEAELSSHLADFAGKVEIAAVNAPDLCVVAGPTEVIEQLERELERTGVMARRLRTSHAFHSAMMQPAVEPLIEFVRSQKLAEPRIPFVSNVTGTWITAAEATDPAYWGRHLRAPVRFADGVRTVAQSAASAFIEVGPGETLKTLARQVLPATAEESFLTSLPHPSKRQPEAEFALSSLGRAWLAGVSIRWDALHASRTPRRLSLPTYPFESRRYWVAPTQSALRPQAPVVQKVGIDDWYWLPSWQRCRPIASLQPRREDAKVQRWLVFADATPTCQAVIAELQRRHIEVITVVAGDSYATLGSDEYQIVPDHLPDYERLLRAISTSELDCIAHLWNTQPPANGGVDLARARREGFYSLLCLAQALGEIGLSRTLPVLVASTDAHKVLDETSLRMEHSLLRGPMLVMSEDVPFLRARSVDYAAADWTVAHAKKLGATLLAESDQRFTENTVAYRRGYRWTSAVSPVRLDAPTDASLPLRQRGAYLITGGIGGIGLTIARHFAQTLGARLVLVSRSGLPPRAQWDELLASAETDPGLKLKLQAVRELEGFGAEVMVAAADVADEAQMREVLGAARERFGVLHGVVHAAGLPGIGMLQSKQPDQVERVLRPKVEGTLLLDRLLAGAELDFLVLCSSVNSIYGWSGTTDYSSANAFLDAFAQSGTARSTARVLSINWGAWRDLGMTAGNDDPHSDNAIVGIPPEDGMQALRRVLAGDYAQVFVTTRPLPTVIAEVGAMTQQIQHVYAGDAEPAAAGVAAHHERPDLAVAYLAPRNAEEEQLADIWSELLGIRPIGINDNFFDLGGHSLLATRVLSRVQHAFKVRMPMRAIFDAPTVAQLAEHVQTAQWTTNAQAHAATEDSTELREEMEL